MCPTRQMDAGDSVVTREEFREFRGEVVGLRSDFQGLQRIVERLAEGLVGLEESVKALVEAQRRTDEALRALTIQVGEIGGAVSGLTVQVGALGENIGFGLEDVARVMLPPWLEKHVGVVVSTLERRFFMVNDRRLEVNLFGEGVHDSRRAIVLGEARSRIYGRDVEEFHRVCSSLESMFMDEVFRVMFGFFIHPVAQEEAQRLGIVLVATYMR